MKRALLLFLVLLVAVPAVPSQLDARSSASVAQQADRAALSLKYRQQVYDLLDHIVVAAIIWGLAELFSRSVQIAPFFYTPPTAAFSEHCYRFMSLQL